MAATMESASASSIWSCRCSSVLSAAMCALLAAALASRSARSLPYIPTCAGMCLNSASILALAKASSTRFVTFQRSAFSSRLPLRVHPSASHSGNHSLMPSTQSWLSLQTTRSLNSLGQTIALRTVMMIAANSDRIALMLYSDLSPNQR